MNPENQQEKPNLQLRVSFSRFHNAPIYHLKRTLSDGREQFLNFSGMYGLNQLMNSLVYMTKTYGEEEDVQRLKVALEGALGKL